MTHPERIGPLFTDLYELTMAAGYWTQKVTETATFSLFTRTSDKRSYYVAAGLEDVLSELSDYHFSEYELTYLRGTGLFSDDFLAYLADFHFTGEIYAMPEGTIFFPDEPILEVTAPMIEAQILETFIINTIGFQSLIATKAARCVCAAQGRPLVDFSMRRTQGQNGGLKVARSSYLAGFAATSNVLAGKRYGIPISGTMAHSFVMAFDSEEGAFSAFADTFPDNSVFLIDTYDTLSGARAAASIAGKMKKRGKKLKGVRLDSGDMAELSKGVRPILDEAGHKEVEIFASSGFDEHKIARVLSGGALIDAFGVGTRMGVSADAPYMDIVYKLVRFKGRDVRKLSPGKITLAGKKQVFRQLGPDGLFSEDIIGIRDETITGTLPLLAKVLKNGSPTAPSPPLQSIRDRFARQLGLLGAPYKQLSPGPTYPVKLSRRLQKVQEMSS